MFQNIYKIRFVETDRLSAKKIIAESSHRLVSKINSEVVKSILKKEVNK